MNWGTVAAGYRQEVPIDRVVKELWRAAQVDPDTDWRRLLQAPAVGRCADIAADIGSPEEALGAVSREVSGQKQSTIATEVAKRAVVQALALGGERRSTFVAALFVQATDYLVSRDLSGYVGKQYRNRTVSEAVAFKEQVAACVRDQVSSLARETGLPQQGDSEAWASFVGRITVGLASS